ncbi:hypothetical protein HDV01_006537 [Terramyces sp. JEL0728]|nr:hypothetical protein HDV01_006537 [Terramyces sp. JEL0728]
MEDHDYKVKPRKKQKTVEVKGLYLETINRNVLDFDFEKLCCVSLTNNNVYGCLTCGKYYQGRGQQSHAFYHSMNEDHHVFINLESLKVYVLPENYEVTDSSLNDIKYVVKPTFTKEVVCHLDKNPSFSVDLLGKKYLPGYIGLNNIKLNDFINVVVLALAHVPPLRDYFLVASFPLELLKRFGMIIRKIWNPKAFKSHISPHELVQEVSNASGKRFKLGRAGDPIDFTSWFLNEIHRGIGGTKKFRSSMLYEIFQGEMFIESQSIVSIGRSEGDSQSFNETGFGGTKSPFLFLSLDLPPTPLFTGDSNYVVPQVTLASLLAKFDGKTTVESNGTLKRYSISQLPPFLILCVKRISKGGFNIERNPTIVNFPLKSLDMSPYLSDDNCDLSTKYDLIANVIHDGDEKSLNSGYKDIFVDEIMPQMLNISESCIQIWQQQHI